MLLNILMGIAITAYLFSILNYFWFKVQVHHYILTVFKIAHFVVLAVLIFQGIVNIFNSESSVVYYAGKYTRFIIFWSFIITGFLLVGFGLRKVKSKLLKTYLFFLQYGVIAITVICFFIPLLGLVGLLTLKELAGPPGKTVYESGSFRVDEVGAGKIMAPPGLKVYNLVKKSGIFETRNSIRIYSDTENMPTLVDAEVQPAGIDSVLVTMIFKEDILVSHDSVSKAITQKVTIN